MASSLGGFSGQRECWGEEKSLGSYQVTDTEKSSLERWGKWALGRHID